MNELEAILVGWGIGTIIILAIATIVVLWEDR